MSNCSYPTTICACGKECILPKTFIMRAVNSSNLFKCLSYDEYLPFTCPACGRINPVEILITCDDCKLPVYPNEVSLIPMGGDYHINGCTGIVETKLVCAEHIGCTFKCPNCDNGRSEPSKDAYEYDGYHFAQKCNTCGYVWQPRQRKDFIWPYIYDHSRPNKGSLIDYCKTFCGCPTSKMDPKYANKCKVHYGEKNCDCDKCRRRIAVLLAMSSEQDENSLLDEDYLPRDLLKMLIDEVIKS